ncbi:UNVERIFIED_CONTAM: hypothetical protein RMT77_001006 [Armadillidium vulgare]
MKLHLFVLAIIIACCFPRSEGICKIQCIRYPCCYEDYLEVCGKESRWFECNANATNPETKKIDWSAWRECMMEECPKYFTVRK